MPTQTEVTPRPGNMGAVIDETERAAADIEKILNRISDAQYERIVDTETKEEECRSIQTMMMHVVGAGYSYANRVRPLFGMPTREPEEKLFSRAEAIPRLHEMLAYTVETFEGRWILDWEEMKQKLIETPSGQRLTIEFLMEHGIVHLLRHRRQIEKFLRIMDNSAPGA